MLQFSQRSNFIKMLGSRICQRLKTTTAHARAVCKSGVVIPLATAAACVAFSASNPTQMKVAAKKVKDEIIIEGVCCGYGHVLFVRPLCRNGTLLATIEFCSLVS